MPTYDLKNVATGEVKEMIVSISKKEEMIASGDWEQVFLGVPTLVTHVGSMLGKTSSDWRNRLSEIKKHSGGNYNNGLSPDKKRKYNLQDNTIHD